MLELASLGAKVLQIRSVKFAMRYGVPIHVRSSFNDDEGTWVVREEEVVEQLVVSGVTCNRNEAKIRVRGVKDSPGVAAAIFTPLSEAGIVVDMIVQNVSQDGTTDVTFTVPHDDFARASDLARDAAVGGRRARRRGATRASRRSRWSGLGMKDHAGVAARMFQVLSREGINIQLISTSEIKISVVIDAKYAELAVRALHDAFVASGEESRVSRRPPGRARAALVVALGLRRAGARRRRTLGHGSTRSSVAPPSRCDGTRRAALRPRASTPTGRPRRPWRRCPGSGREGLLRLVRRAGREPAFCEPSDLDRVKGIGPKIRAGARGTSFVRIVRTLWRDVRGAR